MSSQPTYTLGNTKPTGPAEKRMSGIEAGELGVIVYGGAHGDEGDKYVLGTDEGEIVFLPSGTQYDASDMSSDKTYRNLLPTESVTITNPSAF
jgi:hypothetical protein